MAKAMYEINGYDFSTLEEFYEVVSRVLVPGAEWGHNLDAFNDILRGGFGTPEGGSSCGGSIRQSPANGSGIRRRCGNSNGG